MATVTIDISEYDMLRNGKEQAEAEVKALKEDIKGLKDKSRVIITTITRSLEKSYEMWGHPEMKTVSESTQYTGFDDIEFEIREKLTKKVQKELDERLSFLETARTHYEEERTALKPGFEKEKADLIEKFEKEKAELKKDCSELELSLEEILRKREKIQANLDKIPGWIQRLFGVRLDSQSLQG